MNILTKWKPSKRALCVCYLFGLGACLLTEIIVSRQRGPVLYSNLLFAVLLPFDAWFSQSRVFWGINGVLAGRILSSALIAILFPAALVIFRSEKNTVRVVALICWIILAVSVFYWG